MTTLVETNEQVADVVSPSAEQDASPAGIARRHDLDALRAVAMLLGILLHGALAYIEMPAEAWAVHDENQSNLLEWIMSAIHGFRMPLFFLISGFFTAMLWRKRGLRALITQRAKRIGIPLGIGMVTIIPLTWMVIISIGVATFFLRGDTTTREPEDNLWAAARANDTGAVRMHLENGANPIEQDPMLGITPLALAAALGNDESVELLLEQGADVDCFSRDGSTALHSAAFFGRANAVRILLENGASTEIVNQHGDRPTDVTDVDWEITDSMAQALSIKLNKDDLIASRQEIDLVFTEQETKRQQVAQENGSTVGEDPKSESEVGGVFMLLVFVFSIFPVFHHLWFLWFLIWLIAAFALYAKVLDSKSIKRFPKWLVISPLRFLWLVPLTMIPQALMGLLYPTFGPDTSTGLIPLPTILFYYAIFFFYGAMYYDSDDAAGRVGRMWWILIPVSLLFVFPIGHDLAIGKLGYGSEWIPESMHRPISIFLQVLFAWMMTFGMMGMFRFLCSRESRTMRYISDSSYWLYLTHLPLIIVAQFVVSPIDLPAMAKCVLICVAVSLFLLVIYEFGVRYTIIGTTLNGPRKRRKKERALIDA